MTSRHIMCTYDKITPESAEDGGFSESGWINPGGYELEPPADLCGPAYAEWVSANVEPVWTFDPEDPDDQEAGPVASAAAFLRDAGVSGDLTDPPCQPGDWYSTEREEDYRTGEGTSYSYHLYGFTPEEEIEIARALGFPAFNPHR